MGAIARDARAPARSAPSSTADPMRQRFEVNGDCAGIIAVAHGVKRAYSPPMKTDPDLPYSYSEPKMARLGRKLLCWLGVVAVVVLTVIALKENLEPPNSPTPVVSSVPDPYWGKHGMSIRTVQYPSRWVQMMDLYYRLRLRGTGMGMPLAPGSLISLDHVIGHYYDSMIPRPSSFTIYYSSGLDGAAVSVGPITRTNAGQVVSVPVTLETLLASNGFTVLRLRRNVIKVFPTRMSLLYSNAPIKDLFLEP